ncbi:hypothetical protein Bbelb_423410 [Branchiostoma belcheri]|nr:hypothetical protein Bbelb_423410 [Branchiostoma belcheri]
MAQGQDLPVGLSSVSRLFADDTACHDTIKTTHDQVHLQEDLDKLAEWEGRWKMSFHPQKCSIVHMTRRKKTLERAYELHVLKSGDQREEAQEKKCSQHHHGVMQMKTWDRGQLASHRPANTENC